MGQDPGSDMENRNAEELPSPEVNGGGCLKQSAKALGGLAPGVHTGVPSLTLRGIASK